MIKIDVSLLETHTVPFYSDYGSVWLNPNRKLTQRLRSRAVFVFRFINQSVWNLVNVSKALLSERPVTFVSNTMIEITILVASSAYEILR